MEEIELSRWLFEGRPRQGKNVLPDGLNWLCYFAGRAVLHHTDLKVPNIMDPSVLSEFILSGGPLYFRVVKQFCFEIYKPL